MKLRELLADVNVYGSYKDAEIIDITTDTRTVSDFRGVLFICLKGAQFDGHKYAEYAMERGAAAVLVNRDLGIESQVIVDDTRKALALIAAAWYGEPAKKLRLIGVTGTKGKTSVAHIIKQVLDKISNRPVGIIGTLGNWVGDIELPRHSTPTTPDPMELHTIFKTMLDAGAEYVVMEVSSEALLQNRVYGCTFEAAVFTNLSHEHLNIHGDMESYFKAKSELFNYCRQSVINTDDIYGRRLSGTVTYSCEDSNADIYAENINLLPYSVKFDVTMNKEVRHVRFNIPGMFSVYNALAAISVCVSMGFDLDTVIPPLENVKGTKGRVELVDVGDRDFTLIIDYAHTPDSLLNILKTFKKAARGRVVLLFGCGGDRDKTKRPEMGKIAVENADFVIVTSDNPRTENPADIINDILAGMKDTATPYKVIENRREAIKYALSNALEGDLIILAGKGQETYQIIGKETFHFDEREVVAEILKI